MYLKGKSGKRLEQKLAGGVWMPIRESDPLPGKDLVTTIDIRFQDVAEKHWRKEFCIMMQNMVVQYLWM